MRWTAPERHQCAKLVVVEDNEQRNCPMEVTTIGLDIAKRVFQAHGVDAKGGMVLRRRLQRAEVITFFTGPPLTVDFHCGTSLPGSRPPSDPASSRARPRS